MLANVFNALIPWLGVVIVSVAGYLLGHKKGKQIARQEQEIKVQKQQAQTAQQVRKVKNDVAKSDDSAVRKRASKWVRNPQK